MTEELAEKLAYEAEGVTVYLGDCLEALAHLPEASVDSVVCDPPSGISFMSRSWDTFKGERSSLLAFQDFIATVFYGVHRR